MDLTYIAMVKYFICVVLVFMANFKNWLQRIGSSKKGKM